MGDQRSALVQVDGAVGTTAALALLDQGALQDAEGNYAEAFRLYHLSAAAGSAFAALHLYFCYVRWVGAEPDDNETTRWLEIASAGGCAEAHTTLGWDLLDPAAHDCRGAPRSPPPAPRGRARGL